MPPFSASVSGSLSKQVPLLREAGGWKDYRNETAAGTVVKAGDGPCCGYGRGGGRDGAFLNGGACFRLDH